MENLMQPINTLLDALFFGIISPLFVMIGQGLEFLLLRPMQILQFPPAMQVLVIAVITALFSLYLRKLVRAEEKESDFREKFLAKKKYQEELHLITDWKSREKFAKAMDDDIDEDFKNKEAEIYAAQLKEEGKPENMIEKIIQGKLKKLSSEVCLLEQKFVKDPDTTVGALVQKVAKDAGLTLNVLGFHKMNLGEGIEKKKEDNLAEEVAKMTSGN